MKERYSTKTMHSLPQAEKFEVMGALFLSTPEKLDNLIEIHETVIARGPNPGNHISIQQIEFWKSLVVHLKAARAMFGPGKAVFQNE